MPERWIENDAKAVIYNWRGEAIAAMSKRHAHGEKKLKVVAAKGGYIIVKARKGKGKRRHHDIKSRADNGAMAFNSIFTDTNSIVIEERSHE